MSDNNSSSLAVPVILIAIIAVLIFNLAGGDKKPAEGPTEKPAATADSYTPEMLKIAVLPDEDPSKITKANQKLVEYLEKEVGMKILFSA